MPSLKEYILCCRNFGKTAVLELKNPMPEKAIEGIISEIADLGYIDRTIFISFAKENLVFIRKTLNDQPVQFLSNKFNSSVLDILKENNFDLDLEYKAVDKSVVEICHANGIKVNCWTVNKLADAKRLIDYGVDYITTNIIE